MNQQDNKPLEIEERVVAEIRTRRDKGRAKYGVSMERGDLTREQWLQHAKEEALDLAIYLEKLISEEVECQELKVELINGSKLADALVQHMLNMGASKGTLPVTHLGKQYVVTIEQKDHAAELHNQ